MILERLSYSVLRLNLNVSPILISFQNKKNTWDTTYWIARQGIQSRLNRVEAIINIKTSKKEIHNKLRHFARPGIQPRRK
jgi:hypothetical protein